MADLTSETVSLLVQQELAQIKDAIVRKALSDLLVEPFCDNRYWFYDTEGETFPCWAVAEDPDSGTRYVYCETGFGPSSPWGLVSISGKEMGMDSGWFTSLERAFYDSFASAPLPIWRVVKRAAEDEHREIASDLTADEADALRSQLNNETSSQGGLVYAIEPRTQKWW